MRVSSGLYEMEGQFLTKTSMISCLSKPASMVIVMFLILVRMLLLGNGAI